MRFRIKIDVDYKEWKDVAESTLEGTANMKDVYDVIEEHFRSLGFSKIDITSQYIGDE